MTVNILTDGYKPDISPHKNHSLTMEGYVLKSLRGDTNAIFGAMESPLEDVIEYAVSNGELDELIRMAINRQIRGVA